MKTVIVVSALMFGWAAGTMAWANGGGYSSGIRSVGAFQPINVEQVEMVSEDLSIDLHVEFAEVHIEYVLHNPGKKVNVKAGFPCAVMAGAAYGQKAPDPRAIAENGLRGFAITADDKKLDVAITADALELQPSMGTLEVNSWHVVEMKFDAGQTRRIRVSYQQDYHLSRYSVSDNTTSSPYSLTYLFSAAGLWAGPIHLGNVRVRAVSVNPNDVAFSLAKRFQQNGNEWTWNFRDLEPTLEDDLVISTHPEYSSYYAENGLRYYAYGKEGAKGRRWELHRRADEVEVTSFLRETQNGKGAESEHLLNGAEGRAWVEGVEGDGIGEAMMLRMKKPVKVRRIGLVNGYTLSSELYAANGRVAELAVSVNGGAPMNVAVPDEHLHGNYFYFDLPGTPLVKTVKLTIQKIYPGTRFHDTAISALILVQPLDKAPKIDPVR